MGAYLSEPVTEKHTESGCNGKLSFGATSVQGWRINQEDAHNCILNFDENCSLFAVYDGHGGAEVSDFTSKHFPAFLKSQDTWKQNNIVQALEDGFLSFDHHLTTDAVLTELKEIAGMPKQEDDDSTENKSLVEEACLPIEEVLLKYGICFYRSRDHSSDHRQQVTPDKQASDTDLFPELPTDEPLKNYDSTASSHEVNHHSSSQNNETDSVNTENSVEFAEEKNARRKHKTQTNGEDGNNVDTLCPDPLNSSNDSSGFASPDVKRLKKQDVQNSEDTQGLTPNGNCTKRSDAAAKSSDFEDSEISIPIVSDVVVKNAAATADHLNKCSTNNLSELGVPNGCVLRNESDLEMISSPQKNGFVQPNNSNNSSTLILPEPELPLKPAATAESVLPYVSKQNEAVVYASESKTPSSWKSVASLSDLPDSVSKKGRQEEKVCKGKSLVLNADVSSSEDSDDADYEYNGADEEADTPSSDSTSSKDGSEDTAQTESDDDDDVSGTEKTDSWAEGVEMPESDDEEFIEAREDMFPVPSGDTPGVDSGTTACLAVLKDGVLYVANAGDSRCVLCRGTEAVDLSVDHKPEDTTERQRIENAGGQITGDGRVNGGLNLSRALGDHFYKKNSSLPLRDQMITALPDVRIEKLSPDDRFMVLACDGIWNSLTSQQVVDFVNEKLAENLPISEICEAMCDKCLGPNTSGDGTGCDNMTVIIVDLTKTAASNRNKIELPVADNETG